MDILTELYRSQESEDTYRVYPEHSKEAFEETEHYTSGQSNRHAKNKYQTNDCQYDQYRIEHEMYTETAKIIVKLVITESFKICKLQKNGEDLEQDNVNFIEYKKFTQEPAENRIKC